MQTFQTARMPCPKCGYPCDRATAVDHDARPKVGDFSVCGCCGSILQFDEGECYKLVDPFSFALLPADVRAQLLQFQALCRDFRARQ
jgi:transcription elongation factor Elf1